MVTLAVAAILAGAYVHSPIADYSKSKIEGFAVYTSPAAREHPDTTSEAIRELTCQLKAVVKAVPPQSLATLRTIPFFIEQENPGFPCACYHPSADWLKENGYIPEKRRSIEIANTSHFVSWSRQDQPSMVLHELAHAYHDVMFTFEDRYVAACHRAALLSPVYQTTTHVRGAKVRHYALNNPMEYFAEASEAYFGKNDFFPFDRADLRSADPVGFAMVERLWGVR